jgi:hypothetical protein
MENKTTTVQSKWKAIALSILFLGIICFPAINKKIGLLHEQRNPDFNYTEKPAFDVNHLDPFPNNFEKYYNENIGFTTHALTLNAYLKMNILKTSPKAKALVGKNDWLFSTGKPLNDYRGLNLLSNDEINNLTKILHNRAVRLKEQGGVFYFAIAPNKHRVYPEYLPNNIAKADGVTILDQTVDALKTDTLIHLIDLRKPIEDAKSEHILYYRKDNHWNDFGAFVGYKSIIESIRKEFPVVTPVSLDAYSVDTTKNLVGGDALQIGVDDLIKENRVMLIPKNNLRAHPGIKQNYPTPKDFPYTDDFEIAKVVDDPTLPKAVIIRDSFTDFMLPFLSENFSKSTFIFDNWEYKENRNIIENERPDMVILIAIEQNIRRIIECDTF